MAGDGPAGTGLNRGTLVEGIFFTDTRSRCSLRCCAWLALLVTVLEEADKKRKAVAAMNCIKCPILEECSVSKLTITALYFDGFSIPEKVMALNIEECLLLIAIAKVNEPTET